jgi:hypothetical protein
MRKRSGERPSLSVPTLLHPGKLWANCFSSSNVGPNWTTRCYIWKRYAPAAWKRPCCAGGRPWRGVSSWQPGGIWSKQSLPGRKRWDHGYF